MVPLGAHSRHRPCVAGCRSDRHTQMRGSLRDRDGAVPQGVSQQWEQVWPCPCLFSAVLMAGLNVEVWERVADTSGAGWWPRAGGVVAGG